MAGTSGVWFGERFVDAAQLHARAAVLAAALPAVGVPAGSHVILLARNSLLPIEVALAAARLGVQVVPLSPHSTGRELAYIAEDSDARAVIGDADLVRPAMDALPGLVAVAQRTPLELAEAFDVPPKSQPVPLGAVDYDELIASQRAHPSTVTRAQHPCSPDSTMHSLFYTSGTTGRPKGVVRPAPTQAQVAKRQAVLEALYGCGPDNVALVPVPLCHMFGANFAQTALRLGAGLVVMPRFDPLSFLRLVERHRVTHIAIVPTMYVRLLRLSARERAAYSVDSLQRVVHSAAPVAPAVKEAMIDWFGPVLWEQYGSTELGTVVQCDTQEWLAHRGTVGRSFLGSELAIYDDDGKRCPPGAVGEIYARMHGTPDFTYLGRPEARQAVERDGLISAGDIGELDDDGYLYLHDRRTDLVVSGGNNVYPAEVEHQLGAHPAVEDCVTFGVPDEEFGQRIVAAVSLRAGCDDAALDELRPFLRRELTPYKVPREFVLVDSVPRNHMGKLQRGRAREAYLSARGVPGRDLGDRS